MRQPPPSGWDHDLWFAFCSGVIYEQEVPRYPDGEPMFDADGNPRGPTYG